MITISDIKSNLKLIKSAIRKSNNDLQKIKEELRNKEEKSSIELIRSRLDIKND
jgi:hypothetical protein